MPAGLTPQSSQVPMKPGEIYHLERVPSLHPGGPPKGRYVIIVTREEDIGLDRPIFVVACSASLTDSQQQTAVALPWSRHQSCSTGFKRACWAVPAWLLRVHPSDLGRQVGHVPSSKLNEILRRLPPDPADARDVPQDST